MLLRTAPEEGGEETPFHELACISQLLNIDPSQQGLGLVSKGGGALTHANLVLTQSVALLVVSADPGSLIDSMDGS